MAPRNPNWTRDELILALDVYFAEDFVSNPGSHHDSKMVDLSKLLNSLPIHANRAENATFRNSHGAYRPVSINGTKSRVKLRAWDAGRDLVHSLRPDRLTGELQIDSAIARHWTGAALLGRSDVRRSWRPRWGYDSNGAKSNAKACWCCWTWNDQVSVRLEGFVEMIGLCPPKGRRPQIEIRSTSSSVISSPVRS